MGEWLRGVQDFTGPPLERKRRKNGIRVEQTAWAKHRAGDMRLSSKQSGTAGGWRSGGGKGAAKAVGAFGTALDTGCRRWEGILDEGKLRAKSNVKVICARSSSGLCLNTSTESSVPLRDLILLINNHQ